MPFAGRAGFEGIAIGTDFLGVDETLPGLGNVEEIARWLESTFDRPVAHALTAGNGSAFLARICGAET
jgi:membrane dipeptidase